MKKEAEYSTNYYIHRQIMAETNRKKMDFSFV